MLESFLLRVEQGYSKHNNPYHNLVHAADVAQTTHYIMSQSGLAVSASIHSHFYHAPTSYPKIHSERIPRHNGTGFYTPLKASLERFRLPPPSIRSGETRSGWTEPGKTALPSPHQPQSRGVQHSRLHTINKPKMSTYEQW